MSGKNILGMYVSQIHDHEHFSEITSYLTKNFDVSHINVSQRENGTWLRTIFFQNVTEKYIEKFNSVLLEEIKQKSPKDSWNVYLIDKDKLLELKFKVDGNPFDIKFNLSNEEGFGTMLDDDDQYYFLKSNHLCFMVEDWVRMSFTNEHFSKFDFQSPYGHYLESVGVLLEEFSDHKN